MLPDASSSIQRTSSRFSLMPAIGLAALGLFSFAGVSQATEIGETFVKPCPFGDCSAGIAFTYFGEAVIPTGHMEGGVEFGGISGLDFDESTGRLIALSDDRAEKGPARLYQLDVDITEHGLQGVSVLGHTPLLDPDNKEFAPQSVDPEALRLGAAGLYWTSEGGGPEALPPTIHLSAIDGRHLKMISAPESFNPSADGSSGIRDNLSFEALAILPSGDLLVALEAALQQDGPKPSLLSSSSARMVQLDAHSGELRAQYVYIISPIPQAGNSGQKAMIGLSEMVSIGDGRLLTVERSFAEGAGNTIKIYMVDLLNASNVSDVKSLAENEGDLSPVAKTEVLDLNGMGLTPDNIEAMAIGRGRDGTEILLLAADNNFSARQKTQFFAFKMERRGR